MNRGNIHLRFGWWSLFIYLTLGIALETLHGFKIGWYLDVGNEMRRLMLTLAHAHGTLLALVNIGAGLTAYRTNHSVVGRASSVTLMGATVLVPGGFLLGGWATHGGDPGIGIFLVPIGAALLLYAVGSIAWNLSRAPQLNVAGTI